MRRCACAGLSLISLAGCGGGDSSSNRQRVTATPETPISQHAYVTTVTALCERYARKLDAIPAQPASRGTEDIVAWTDRMSDLGREFAAELEPVEPPADVRAPYKAFVEIIREKARLFDDFGRAAKTRDLELLDRANRALQAESAEDEAAAAGIPGCA